MTPVIHLKNGIAHGKIFYPVFKFIIKNFPAHVKILVIHSHRQYEMTEFPFGNRLAPRHLLFCFERRPHVRKKEFRRIRSYIRSLHVCVKPFHCLPLILPQGIERCWRKAVKRTCDIYSSAESFVSIRRRDNDSCCYHEATCNEYCRCHISFYHMVFRVRLK